MIAIELEGLQKRYNTDIEHELARVPVKTDYSVTLIFTSSRNKDDKRKLNIKRINKT